MKNNLGDTKGDAVATLLSLSICPTCGSPPQKLSGQFSEGMCSSCNESWRIEENMLIWSDNAETAIQSNEKSSLRQMLKKASAPSWLLENIQWRAAHYLHPLKSPFSPLTHFAKRRVGVYYQRTLKDRDLAEDWTHHYFKGLMLRPGAWILDHGCGRGRHVGLATQLGYKVYSQDIIRDDWWRNLPDCGFQVVSPDAMRLPWRNQLFDLVLNFLVISFLDGERLECLAREANRVLKTGGYWIILEANSEGYGAHIPRKNYGRLHTLRDTIRVVTRAGFKVIDVSYEGFYAPIFPVFINFLRRVCAPWPLDLADYHSWLARAIPQERRALWLLRMTKP